MTTETILRLNASTAPSTFDAENQTVEAVAITATPVLRRDQRGPYLEILDAAGADLSGFKRSPVLDTHRQGAINDVIGVVDDAWVEVDKLICRIRFSNRVSPELLSDVEQGVLKSVPIGYQVAAKD